MPHNLRMDVLHTKILYLNSDDLLSWPSHFPLSFPLFLLILCLILSVSFTLLHSFHMQSFHLNENKSSLPLSKFFASILWFLGQIQSFTFIFMPMKKYWRLWRCSKYKKLSTAWIFFFSTQIRELIFLDFHWSVILICFIVSSFFYHLLGQ